MVLRDEATVVPCGQCLFTGLDYWTALLDWTTGHTQNVFSSHFQCRREANHVYSSYFFAKFAPLTLEATLQESVEVTCIFNELQQ